MPLTYKVGRSAVVLQYSGNLVSEQCGVCRIMFAMPEELYDYCQRYNSAAFPLRYAKFFCPNGHEIHYLGKNADQQRIAALQAENNDLAHMVTKAQDATALARRQLAARKGQLTKMRNRYAAGVCPVASCHANLGNRVRDHIAKVHPEFRMADIEALPA